MIAENSVQIVQNVCYIIKKILEDRSRLFENGEKPLHDDLNDDQSGLNILIIQYRE
jgi:hypothetical protein